MLFFEIMAVEMSSVSIVWLLARRGTSELTSRVLRLSYLRLSSDRYVQPLIPSVSSSMNFSSIARLIMLNSLSSFICLSDFMRRRRGFS